MSLVINKIQYHRNKDFVEITDAQALLLISDMITAALGNSGFTAEITISNDDEE